MAEWLKRGGAVTWRGETAIPRSPGQRLGAILHEAAQGVVETRSSGR